VVNGKKSSIIKVFIILFGHLDLRISPRILKKLETALKGYSGAEGKLIHEKTEKTNSKKSRDTAPLT
jgi:hypothetical protein